MATVSTERPTSQRPDSTAERPWRKKSSWRRILECWQLYVLMLAPVVVMVIFTYLPMIGVQIAFRDYNPVDGQWGSPWVGMRNFVRFFESYQFWPIIRNTLILHGYELLATFPLPIILALALNHLRRKAFSRTVQMITYAPHFISTVVVVGMLFMLLDPETGLVHNIMALAGWEMPDIINRPEWFRHLYVWSGAWQGMGFSAIIYLAALSGVDPGLHEAAIVDGCSTLKRMWHVDLPSIAPVAVILLILSMGNALKTGFEKVLLMQNPLNLGVSEVIDTYVYKVSLGSQLPQFSYGAAINVFQSLVGLILILVANRLARKFSSGGLW